MKGGRLIAWVYNGTRPQSNDLYTLVTLSLIGRVHIGARALLDLNLICMVWIYRPPIPVGRRGYLPRSSDFYLPSLRSGEGEVSTQWIRLRNEDNYCVVGLLIWAKPLSATRGVRGRGQLRLFTAHDTVFTTKQLLKVCISMFTATVQWFLMTAQVLCIFSLILFCLCFLKAISSKPRNKSNYTEDGIVIISPFRRSWQSLVSRGWVIFANIIIFKKKHSLEQ